MCASVPSASAVRPRPSTRYGSETLVVVMVVNSRSLASAPPPAASGVPVGAQIAWLSSSTAGWPATKTRVAATTHCAVTHGPLPAGGTKAQPATM